MQPFLIRILFIWLSLFVSNKSFAEEEKLAERIYAHLLIKDTASACKEASLNVQNYPFSQPLWEAYITALGEAGYEREMITAWKTYNALDPALKNQKLLEHMAWSIIKKGSGAPSPITRAIALLGAFYAQDARGVKVIREFLYDSNSLLRNLALQLSSQMRDATLCEGVLHCLRHEKVWRVRLEAIKAVGMMKITTAKPTLVALIADDKTTAEEKVSAIHSLVHLLDAVNRYEVIQLAKSNRAGLRVLACEVVAYFNLEPELDQIFPLLKDHSSEVRAAALQVFGILRISSYNGQSLASVAALMTADRDQMVAVTAGWVLTLNDPNNGQQFFQNLMSHEDSKLRLLATSALCACGKYAFPLAIQEFNSNKDIFVQMNLALLLINQRQETEKSAQVLYEGFIHAKERWMWLEQGVFRSIAPSNLSFEDALDQHPEIVNQLVHLEILNLMVILNYPKAQEAITEFLQQKTWGISGTAAALLLTEGDEGALDLVKNLITHPHYKVRIQAALILALWGRGEDAISVLEQAYSTADRELKEKIIEGIGSIGATSSIPFLLTCLEESSQTLRIIAACALLQSLYH